MKSMRAMISPAMLRWAREQAGLDLEFAARKLEVELQVWTEWENGEKAPTFCQARDLAHKLHVPFGYLYLKVPPSHLQRASALLDFRTVNNEGCDDGYSQELQEVLADAQRKQEWLCDLRREEGDNALGFVGKYHWDEVSAEDLAHEIAQALDMAEISQAERKEGQFIAVLVRRVETLGVCVLRSGVVNGNVHRPLSVKEFRGFVLSDPWAPMIFLNSRDAWSALPFTLIHELAHLWLGQSGVSAGIAGTGGLAKERLCNQVAAAVLVNAEVLRKRLADCSDDAAVLGSLKKLVSQFGVSEAVLAIRASDLGLLSRQACWEFVGQRSVSQPQKPQGSGGNYYRAKIAAISRSFATEVLHAVDANEILLRDAAQLLEVNHSHLDDLRSAIHNDERAS